jgi:hypothetical protein
VAAVPIVLALSACGGAGGGDAGGGGGRTAQPPPSSPVLTLSQAAVSGKAFQSEYAFFDVTLTFAPTVDLRNGVTIEASYDHSVLANFSLVLFKESATARLSFSSLPTLPVGEYVDSIGLRVCKTDSCTEKYSDVPASLGYQLTISTAPPAAIVMPTSFTSTVEAGTRLEVVLSAEVRPDIRLPTGSAYFSVTDTHGLFTPNPTSVSQGGDLYAVTLVGVDIETPGTYSGVVSLIVCRFVTCPENPAAGSPIAIPLRRDGNTVDRVRSDPDDHGVAGVGNVPGQRKPHGLRPGDAQRCDVLEPLELGIAVPCRDMGESCHDWQRQSGAVRDRCG